MKSCFSRRVGIQPVVSGLVMFGIVSSATSRVAQAAPIPADITERGRIGQWFGVNGTGVKASNLRNLPGNINVAAPAGHHIIAFTLSVNTAGNGSAARSGFMLESLRGVRGESIEAPSFSMTSAAASSLMPQGDDVRIIEQSSSHDFTLVRAVRNTARTAFWRGVLVTNVNRNNQRPMEYVIDLGTLPTYRAPVDVRGVMGKWVKRDGALVKVVKASVVPRGTASNNGSDALARAILGANRARPGQVAVKVQVMIGNPLTTPVQVNQMNSVSLEDTTGRRYGVDVLGASALDQSSVQSLPEIDLQPQKQVEGFVVFTVPHTKLSSLRVRFNPAYGRGHTVVPLGVVR